MTTKRILVVAGPNGSGKSSVVTSTDLHIIENKIINPDNYVEGWQIFRMKSQVSDCDGYLSGIARRSSAEGPVVRF